MRPWHRFALLLATLLWAAVGYSQDLCATQQFHVAKHAQLLHVAQNTLLTPSDVLAYPNELLRPVASERYLGNSSANRWLRIHVPHTGAETCTRWLRVGPAWLRYVDVYLPNETGWQHIKAGAGYPFTEWPAGDRRPVFPITITPGDNIILVNVQSTGEAVSFHPVLWDPVVFQQADFTNALTDGITYGLLLLLVLVSLCLSAVFRRGQLSLMAMSVFFYICLDAAQKNYLLKYWWPGAPLFDRWAVYFVAGLHFLSLFAYLFALAVVHLGNVIWRFSQQQHLCHLYLAWALPRLAVDANAAAPWPAHQRARYTLVPPGFFRRPVFPQPYHVCPLAGHKLNHLGWRQARRAQAGSPWLVAAGYFAARNVPTAAAAN